MRQLARYEDEQLLTTFAEFLYTEDIESSVEKSSDGNWEIWILDDDLIESAKEYWQEFQQNPEQFKKAATAGRQKLENDRKQAEKTKNKVVDVRTARNAASGDDLAVVSVGAIVISIGLFGAGLVDPEFGNRLFYAMAISDPRLISQSILPEVFSGQVWRLLTPVFLHGGLLHIFFNMYWMAIMAPGIERLIGLPRFAIFFLFAGIFSNLLQYFIVGPNFVGMSGVVYAVIGFAWMAQKQKPLLNLGMTDQLWMFAMIWMGVGFLNDFVPIFGFGLANWAHLGGLIAGLLAAWTLNQLKMLPQQMSN